MIIQLDITKTEVTMQNVISLNPILTFQCFLQSIKNFADQYYWILYLSYR